MDEVILWRESQRLIISRVCETLITRIRDDLRQNDNGGVDSSFYYMLITEQARPDYQWSLKTQENVKEGKTETPSLL